MATALYEGAALLGLAVAVFPGQVPFTVWLSAAGVALAGVNAMLWRRYRNAADAEGLGAAARRALARITPWLHGFGHALPAALFLGAAPSDQPAVWLGLAGIAALAGGAGWKFTVVVLASYQQGYAVPRLPQRGSGTRAAPTRSHGPQPVAYQIPTT